MRKTLHELAKERQQEEGSLYLSEKQYKPEMENDAFWLGMHTQKRKILIYVEGFLFPIKSGRVLTSTIRRSETPVTITAFLTEDSFIFDLQ